MSGPVPGFDTILFMDGVAKSSTKTAQKNHKRSTKITLYFGGVFREKLFPCINFLGVGVGSGGKFFLAYKGGSVNRPATTRHVISVYSRSLAGL